MKKSVVNVFTRMRGGLLFVFILVGFCSYAQSPDDIIRLCKSYPGTEYVTYNKSELNELYKELPEGDYMKILAKKGNSIKAVSIDNISVKEQKKIHQLVKNLDESDYVKMFDESDNQGNIFSLWFFEDDDNYLITDVVMYIVEKGKTAMLFYAKGKYPESDIERVEALLIP